MSSDTQSVLGILRMNNYACVIVVTVVMYDYLLTFPREIEYVWLRPWTWVSTMFLLVRYIGLCWAILFALDSGSSFIPATIKDQYEYHHFEGTIISVIACWQFPILLNTADLVMILRVYAMWNRSRWILYILLLIYVPQFIVSFAFVGIYNNPKTYFSVKIVRVLDFSTCSDSWKNLPPLFNVYDELPRFVLGSALLILAVIRTTKESIEMYRATKQWQPNRYMKLLVKDGILYFLANMIFNIAYALQPGFIIQIGNTLTFLLNLYCKIAFFPLIPRFIISVRELHNHGPRVFWKGVDSGFGVLSESLSVNDSDEVVTTIEFSNTAQLGHDPLVEEERRRDALKYDANQV